MELQADNAKLDQTRDASMQPTAVIEQIPQASSEMRSHKDTKEGQIAKDGMQGMNKKPQAARNFEWTKERKP